MDNHYDQLAYYTLGLQDDYFIHQHIVDAYTAQTATADTKSIRITFALVGLYLLINKNFTGKQVQQFHALMAGNKMDWPSFVLPNNRGAITVAQILDTAEGEARNNAIKKWCACVWDAYADSHAEIKVLADYYLAKLEE
jgi:hypothetical protein